MLLRRRAGKTEVLSKKQRKELATDAAKLVWIKFKCKVYLTAGYPNSFVCILLDISNQKLLEEK